MSLETPVVSAPCQRVRSTLLHGSLRAIRARGLADRYLANIAPEMVERISAVGVPQWFPLAVAEAHYGACDAMRLSVDAMLELGAQVAPTAASGVQVVLHAARTTGATPWTVMERALTYWGRMYDGSALAITHRGPKDAHIAVHANALARYAYWRIGFRGVITALARSLALSVVAREVDRAPDAVTYSLSWV